MHGIQEIAPVYVFGMGYILKDHAEHLTARNMAPSLRKEGARSPKQNRPISINAKLARVVDTFQVLIFIMEFVASRGAR
jgi:hypothetical protein